MKTSRPRRPTDVERIFARHSQSQSQYWLREKAAGGLPPRLQANFLQEEKRWQKIRSCLQDDGWLGEQLFYASHLRIAKGRRMVEKQNRQLTYTDVPWILVVGFLSFVFHELAHGLCGKLLGYDMYVGINKAGLASGAYSQEWHQHLVSGAGPMLTIAAAVVGAWLVSRYDWVQVFPIVFFSAMMRTLASLVSVINPNDEARISQWLGIGKWSLPLLVTFFLGALTVWAAKRLRLNWQSWLVCFIASSIALLVVVTTESHWPILGL